MSQDAPVSRKERKAQRDAERQQKGKKRRRDEFEEHEGGTQSELQQDFIPLNGDVPTPKGQSTKKGEESTAVGDKSHPSDAPKTKRRKKAKKQTTQNEPSDQDNGASEKNTAPRFILFIGNLPYASTDATLREHFKKIEPFTLRHRTDPKTKKSKGFAFLEFENYDRMKTCLKLYHHSIFDPGQDAPQGPNGNEKKRKDQGGRRINVELTAGGGGKAEGRKEKIKAKNVKLDEQRKRRAELERKEKEKQRRKNGEADETAAGEPESADKKDGTAGVHPSRLARIQQ